mgnify:CR=1 FL=1
MKNKSYGFPNLPNSGLANMLITWADCYIWCKDLEVKQIAPLWRKIRIGPYIRGERDKRQYQRLFSNGKKINGITRLLLMLVSTKVSAEEVRKPNYEKKSSLFPTMVTFSSMNNLHRLNGRHNEILKEIYNITKPKYWPTELPKAFIGIHIRRGDFGEKSNEIKQTNFRIPIEWYIEALAQIRQGLGYDFPVVVFSDGTDQEIEPILSLPNVSRSPCTESISDLLAISKATVLITSRSSYSLFGAFLGQVPSVWYLGKKDVYSSTYMSTENDSALELEWMPGQTFSDYFISSLKKKAIAANSAQLKTN